MGRGRSSFACRSNWRDRLRRDRSEALSVSRSLRLLRENESRWRVKLPSNTAYLWGPFERGFVESLTVYDLSLFKREAESLFSAAPLISMVFVSLQDPGALRDIPAVSRVRYLSIHTQWPPGESVRHLAGATNLSALEQFVVLGPTMDFALEDLLVERFGLKLHRGI